MYLYKYMNGAFIALTDEPKQQTYVNRKKTSLHRINGT